MNKLINFFLSLITIICIYTIFSVGLDLIEKIGISDNYEKINNVALNLSYSYIAGLIFYFFISYLPYIQKKKKLNPAINSKIEYLNDLIKSFIQTFELQEKNINLKTTQNNYIEELIINRSLIDSSYYSKMGRNMTNLDFINGHKVNIQNLITDIITYKEYISSEQVLNLEQIRDSKFFQLLKIDSNNQHFLIYFNDDVTRKMIAKELNDIIGSVNKLEK